HPPNCSDPNVKFLLADWERLPGFGIGAQIAGMCGLLSIAINEGRVLVTNFYNRADHDGCKGSSRSSWNCYFFPETSLECRQRAFELMKSEDALNKGILTTKENYTIWGDPWNFLQPTTDINGSLVASHRKMDRRWWRAQAVRYLMRFPTEYTCNLLNEERHAAFGKIAAKMVLESLAREWPKMFQEENGKRSNSDIDKYVWSNHKPWVPRPLLSMHVRMGDKACEMRVVEFEEYIQLADRIRSHFPNLNSIWLSTEMQEVVDKTKEYSSRWNFHYTKVRRQDKSNVSMAEYESSLGRERSTNYPLVNFLMAADSDFFVGALGSTWCFLIDGMRNTGGKVMSGYLSVNKDRFW
ncbi:coatomer protein, partial [Trifolium pratense]